MHTLMASELVQNPGVRPVLGFWQEVVPLLEGGSFDAIFFDPFPNDDDALTEQVIHQHGFMSHALRLLAAGGVFVCVLAPGGVYSLATSHILPLPTRYPPCSINSLPAGT